MGSKNAMANYLRRISTKEGGGGGGRGNKPNDHQGQGQGQCKRHPKHKQSPGVCSLCLVEKLSRLSAQYSKKTTTSSHHHDEVGGSDSCSSSSSLSSYYSSSSATSCSSPMHGYRFGSTQGKGASLTLLLFSGKNRLIKSRSVAFAPRAAGKEVANIGDDDDDHHHHHHNKKKKDGFLSKLLHPRRAAHHHETSKKEAAAAGLAHSRTVRDILTS